MELESKEGHEEQEAKDGQDMMGDKKDKDDSEAKGVTEETNCSFELV